MLTLQSNEKSCSTSHIGIWSVCLDTQEWKMLSIQSNEKRLFDISYQRMVCLSGDPGGKSN